MLQAESSSSLLSRTVRRRRAFEGVLVTQYFSRKSLQGSKLVLDTLYNSAKSNGNCQTPANCLLLFLADLHVYVYVVRSTYVV